MSEAISKPLPCKVMIEPKDAGEYDRVTQQHVILVERETDMEFVTCSAIFPKFAWRVVAF